MTFRGEWQSNFVQYNVGDVVSFQGTNYKNIQAHRSQSDWPPTATPALWEQTNGQAAGGYQQPPAQPTPPAYGGGGGYGGGSGGGYGGPDETKTPPPKVPGYGGEFSPSMPHQADVPPEKHWWDLEGDEKKGLLIGGSVAAVGLAALGGYFAHEKHKKSGEAKKDQAEQLGQWIKEAHANTEDFVRNGPKGPYTWLLNDVFGSKPNYFKDLIKGGEEDGQPWFIARAYHHGTMQPGKARLQPNGTGYAFIGYGNEAIKVNMFEVLMGNQSALKWVRAHKNLDVSDLKAQPVKAGRDGDGSELYISRIRHRGAVIPGKASTVLRGGYATWEDDEIKEDDYEVLCLC